MQATDGKSRDSIEFCATQRQKPDLTASPLKLQLSYDATVLIRRSQCHRAIHGRVLIFRYTNLLSHSTSAKRKSCCADPDIAPTHCDATTCSCREQRWCAHDPVQKLQPPSTSTSSLITVLLTLPRLRPHNTTSASVLFRLHRPPSPTGEDREPTHVHSRPCPTTTTPKMNLKHHLLKIGKSTIAPVTLREAQAAGAVDVVLHLLGDLVLPLGGVTL